MRVTVAMAEAVGLIASMRPLESAGRPFVVGVTGPVGAGKSTLAARLSHCVIATDHYLPDYDATPQLERDLPERSDLSRLLSDLRSLRTGAATAIPQWSFHTHSRVGEKVVEPAELIVVEGLHALHETHANALDVRVYVDAPAPVRLDRWENLARTGERGWGVEETREFFVNVAEPTFHARSGAYRESAHVVVVNA